MQRNLDKYIESNHQLEGQDLIEEKMLALLVELGEMANETRCFKFWSTKGKSDQGIILEEYVDNIHFLLSIGLEKGYHFTQIDPSKSNETETKQFNYVFDCCLQFYRDQSEYNY